LLKNVSGHPGTRAGKCTRTAGVPAIISPAPFRRTPATLSSVPAPGMAASVASDQNRQPLPASHLMMTRLLQLLLVVLAAMPALAGLELTLRVDSKPYSGKSLGFTRVKGQKEEPPEQWTARVKLDGSSLWYEREGETTVYDFAQRRIYVSEANKPLVERSLFSEVGGRDREMTNRVYLIEVMGGKAAIPLAVSEHGLSMDGGRKKGKVDRAEKGGTVRFRANRLDLADYPMDFVDATNEERAGFARFIALTFNAHPVVLADLRQAKGIPRTLRIVQHTVSRELLISVTGAAPSTDTPPAISPERHLMIESDKDLAPLVAAAAAISPLAADSAERKILTDGTAFAAAGANLDAFLAWMEYGLMTGRDLPADIEGQMSALANDPKVRVLRTALSPQSASEARQALTVLQGLRSSAPAKAHILTIFEGDFLMNLGESAAAEKKFLEVLRKQPRIAGVWKDLGDLYYNGYDPTRAWDCWTVARSIAPNHRLLGNVNKLEEYLAATYPGFF